MLHERNINKFLDPFQIYSIFEPLFLLNSHSIFYLFNQLTLHELVTLNKKFVKYIIEIRKLRGDWASESEKVLFISERASSEHKT